jgi:hypothetical protein
MHNNNNDNEKTNFETREPTVHARRPVCLTMAGPHPPHFLDKLGSVRGLTETSNQTTDSRLFAKHPAQVAATTGQACHPPLDPKLMASNGQPPVVAVRPGGSGSRLAARWLAESAACDGRPTAIAVVHVIPPLSFVPSPSKFIVSSSISALVASPTGRELLLTWSAGLCVPPAGSGGAGAGGAGGG